MTIKKTPGLFSDNEQEKSVPASTTQAQQHRRNTDGSNFKPDRRRNALPDIMNPPPSSPKP